MTLRGLLEDAAAGLGEIDLTTGAHGAITWSHAGRPFAALNGDGGGAEFRLDTAVAAAAMRTPDVVPSDRGQGWVLFRPAALDDHAADRAVAWFASAHRRAATG